MNKVAKRGLLGYLQNIHTGYMYYYIYIFKGCIIKKELVRNSKEKNVLLLLKTEI